MEKIQFKDLPDMTTPLSSANLNQMQDNMENAIIPIKLVSISDAAPESATVGDMYYNTTDNKVYTATAENTWNSGETPRYDGFYVNMETNLMYYYNGTSLIKSGGDIAPSVKNEKTTSETDVYSCNYINNKLQIEPDIKVVTKNVSMSLTQNTVSRGSFTADSIDGYTLVSIQTRTIPSSDVNAVAFNITADTIYWIATQVNYTASGIAVLNLIYVKNDLIST